MIRDVSHVFQPVGLFGFIISSEVQLKLSKLQHAGVQSAIMKFPPHVHTQATSLRSNDKRNVIHY